MINAVTTNVLAPLRQLSPQRFGSMADWSRTYGRPVQSQDFKLKDLVKTPAFEEPKAQNAQSKLVSGQSQSSNNGTQYSPDRNPVLLNYLA